MGVFLFCFCFQQEEEKEEQDATESPVAVDEDDSLQSSAELSPRRGCSAGASSVRTENCLMRLLFACASLFVGRHRRCRNEVVEAAGEVS